MTGRWTRRGAAIAIAGAIALGSCGDGDDTSASDTAGTGTDDGHDQVDKAGDDHAAGGTPGKPAFAPADADVTVDVVMTDFAFRGVPADVAGTKVLFKVANQGPSEHEFVVFKEGGDDAVGGVHLNAKGQARELAVEMTPGAYTVRCLVKVGDQTHADLGMQTNFTVR